MDSVESFIEGDNLGQAINCTEKILGRSPVNETTSIQIQIEKLLEKLDMKVQILDNKMKLFIFNYKIFILIIF